MTAIEATITIHSSTDAPVACVILFYDESHVLEA